MLVRVEVAKIVGLLGKLDASGAVAKLLNQKGVVLLHDLPYQLPRYCRHFLTLNLTQFTQKQINEIELSGIELVDLRTEAIHEGDLIYRKTGKTRL